MEKKKSRIISVDDIERKNSLLKREQMRNDIFEDINDVIGKVGFSIGPKKNKKRSLSTKILIWLGILILFLVALNFILGNIWLLKFFVQDFSKIISGWFA